MAALASGSAMWAAPPQQADSSDTQAAKLPADQMWCLGLASLVEEHRQCHPHSRMYRRALVPSCPHLEFHDTPHISTCKRLRHPLPQVCLLPAIEWP
jgi:hypothetical protein